MNIVAITPDRENYIRPIEKYLNFPLVFLKTTDWDEFIRLKPCAAIFLADWSYELLEIVEECKKNRIPTILMMDGTIEWKHFFENPKWSFGKKEAPFFPVYCDKVFVPGYSTYRFLEFFGNEGRTEITGLPRFDGYKNAVLERREILKPTIGIMSGNTAGYTPLQIDQTIQLFTDLYNWSIRQNEIVIKWRLRKGFEKLLDFEILNNNEGSLADFLSTVSAVVSQPSTAAFEAMLTGVPVALADYNIAPNYMHGAWEIKSNDQIAFVLSELVKPAPHKILYQQQLLEETIAYCGMSSKVCATIINEMIGQAENLSIENWKFQPNMAFKIASNMELPNEVLNTDLFPFRVKYKFSDVAILQEELIKKTVLIEKLQLLLRNKWIEFFVGKRGVKLVVYIKKILK